MVSNILKWALYWHCIFTGLALLGSDVAQLQSHLKIPCYTGNAGGNSTNLGYHGFVGTVEQLIAFACTSRAFWTFLVSYRRRPELCS